MAIPEYLKLKPVDAIAALRDRLSIPLSDYKGLDARIHDHAFMVSGLMRADLLEATKWLIDRSLEEGTSFEQFTRSFNRRIGRAGYQPNGQKIKLIFDTNINKSYWQGREKVMRSPEMLAKRPLWLFKHRDSVVPRPTHKALDGKAIPADHKFWKELGGFPISFGCRCSAFSVTEDYCKRNGIEILNNPPDASTLIDSPSFKRGTDMQTREQILEQGLKRLSPDLRAQVQKQVKRNETKSDALKKVEVPASKDRRAYSYYRNSPYQEEAGGLFSSKGADYDLNKIFRITSKKEVKNVPVGELKWILRYVPDEDSDRDRTAKADLSAPVIVVRQKGRSVVVDGVHRLRKAVSQKDSSIKAVYITPLELKSAVSQVEKQIKVKK